MAVCPFCKTYMTTKEDGKTYKGKKYHPACFEKILDDMESGDDERVVLDKYICKLFGIKRITPLINEQISTFTKTNGYSLTGIRATLYYFFELEGREITEDVKGIGIVPYVYDEARDFFREISRIKEKNKGFKEVITKTKIQIKRPNKSISKIDIGKIE